MILNGTFHLINNFLWSVHNLILTRLFISFHPARKSFERNGSNSKKNHFSFSFYFIFVFFFTFIYCRSRIDDFVLCFDEYYKLISRTSHSHNSQLTTHCIMDRTMDHIATPKSPRYPKWARKRNEQKKKTNKIKNRKTTRI